MTRVKLSSNNSDEMGVIASSNPGASLKAIDIVFLKIVSDLDFDSVKLYELLRLGIVES